MFPSLLTVILFSLSAVAGERTARAWGGQRGNMLRLALALAIMGSVTLAAFPASLHAQVTGWLLLSGAIGFGVGDIALFLAYNRVGARLAVLLNLCTAPVWAALFEWGWLGTLITGRQCLAGLVILTGVAIAVSSRAPAGRPRSGSFAVGVLCGLAAGMGQGVGAVISRKAIENADALGVALNGFSAAAQRVGGGFGIALLAYALTCRWDRNTPWPSQGRRTQATAWLVATTFAGPILGVSAFQWALASTSAGVVLALVATTPIALIPLALWIDKEAIRPASVAGALLGVAGVLIMLQA